MPVWRSAGPGGTKALMGGDPKTDHGRTGTAVGGVRGDGGGGWRGEPPRAGGCGTGVTMGSRGVRGVRASPPPPPLRARRNTVRVAASPAAPAKASGGGWQAGCAGGGGRGRRAGGRRKVAEGRRRASPQASSGMKAPGGTIRPYAPASSPNHGAPSCRRSCVRGMADELPG